MHAAAEGPAIRRNMENHVEKAKMQESVVENCEFARVMAVTSLGY